MTIPQYASQILCGVLRLKFMVSAHVIYLNELQKGIYLIGFSENYI